MNRMDRILNGLPGDVMFLLGNEAIARGAIEAGVGFATTYPGTPSSEVGDTLSKVARKGGFYFEFSVNEKVATEMAYAAAISGVRSFVFMKHVGMNVAADAIMSMSYAGVRGGMVIMTADDPSMFSSQNEQHNRHYAELAHLPMLEPSNPQEAKDFVIRAFEISEKFRMPVILRTTTRVSHQRTQVKLGSRSVRVVDAKFDPAKGDFVTLPSSSMGFKSELIEKMELARQYCEKTDLNRTETHGSGKYGFITSGEAYNCLTDAIRKHSIDASVYKIGMTSPLPEEEIASFLSLHESVFVVEELDPYLESGVRRIAQMHSSTARIYGKIDGIFPASFEYSPEVVASSLSGIINIEVGNESPPVSVADLPKRPPVLCPGCPHRATYYAVRRAARMSGLSDVIYSSDIGCYSLGTYEPFEMADVLLEMGSSIGVGSGLSKVTGRHVIAFIGDSTFYHAGIPPLINAVRNGSRMTVVIMDNDITAMTGQQTNPGVPYDGMGQPVKPVSMEAIVRAVGIDNVVVADPYDLKSFLPTVMKALKSEGVSVVIARRECAILRDREMQRKGERVVYAVDSGKCGLCMNCVENFSCPAISIQEGKIAISPDLCDGCGVCAEPIVCPFRAIAAGE